MEIDANRDTEEESTRTNGHRVLKDNEGQIFYTRIAPTESSYPRLYNGAGRKVKIHLSDISNAEKQNNTSNQISQTPYASTQLRQRRPKRNANVTIAEYPPEGGVPVSDQINTAAQTCNLLLWSGGDLPHPIQCQERNDSFWK